MSDQAIKVLLVDDHTLFRKGLAELLEQRGGLTVVAMAGNGTEALQLWQREQPDVVIVDAMYGFLDYHDHINFGHSTIFNFIDFFREANIGELVIFHHDPLASDTAVSRLRADAERYKQLIAPQARWTLSAAREGQSWDFPPVVS